MSKKKKGTTKGATGATEAVEGPHAEGRKASKPKQPATGKSRGGSPQLSKLKIRGDSDGEERKTPPSSADEGVGSRKAEERGKSRNVVASSSGDSSEGDAKSPSSSTSPGGKRKRWYPESSPNRRYSFQLHQYEQLPPWLRDNKFITGSYRVNFSWRLAFESIFRVHNETMNIWTHLLGAIIFVALMVHMINNLSPHGIDRHPVTVNQGILQVQGFLEDRIHNLQRAIVEAKDEAVVRTSQSLKNAYEFIHRNLEEPLVRSLLQAKANASGFIQHIVENKFSDVFHKIDLNEFVDAWSTKKDAVVRSDLLAKVSEAGLTGLAGLSHQDFLEFIFRLEEPAVELLPNYISRDVKSVSYLSRTPLAIFMISAATCFTFSALFHTFGVRSRYVASIFQRLDYMGIGFLISGTASAVIFYGFYCDSRLLLPYYALVISLPLIPISYAFIPFLLRPEYSSVRAGTFVFVGIFVAVPLIHLIYMLGEVPPFFWDVVYGGISYIVGAGFYGSRYPERAWPGKFDIWFQSHSIFHTFVVCGALLHYKGLMTLYEWRIVNSCIP